MQSKNGRLHDFVHKVPGIIEKVVAAILVMGIAYGCVRLVLQAFVLPEVLLP